MKDIKIKYKILYFMLGVIVTMSTVGYAAYKYQASEVGYTPSNSEFKVDNVENAINELYEKVGKTYTVYTNGQAIYYNPVTNEKCSESEATQNYTTNGVTGTKTGCMKWYTFNDEGENASEVNMILDHNTTEDIKWHSSGTNVAYEDSLVKTDIDKLVSESGWKVTPRIISATEVNTITGKTNFDVSNKDSWYYLDSRDHTLTTNASSKSKYAWLFDYTVDCVRYGCNVEDNSTYGYWTSTPIGNVGSGSCVWEIWYFATLSWTNGNACYNYGGIRPVITVSKKVIK